MIDNSFIRHNLIRKFYGFNKIIYWLKVQPKYDLWLDKLEHLHNLLSSKIIITHGANRTLQHQIPLSQSRGGFGLRNPKNYQYAAEISTLRDKDEILQRFFPFNSLSYNLRNMDIKRMEIQDVSMRLQLNESIVSNFEIKPINTLRFELKNKMENNELELIKSIDELNHNINQFNILRNEINGMNWFIADSEFIDLWNTRFQRLVDNHQERYQMAINKFNDFIGPNYVFNEFRHKTHNSLLDLMDKKHFIEYQAKASQLDMARIYSISNSGAMSWTNVIYNWEVPRRLSNQQMFIALSLVMGLPIFPYNNIYCLRCKNKMDIYGHHCLSCVDTDYLYKRHDRLVDILFHYAKLAGFVVFKDARYEKVDGKWIRRHSRPGDIAIVNWQLDDNGNNNNNGNGNNFIEDNKTYFDLTVGNIFSGSYIKHTSKSRLYLAKFKEKEKEKKYGNKDDIWGLGLECLGGMSPKFKELLQDIAEQLENKTEINRSIWMNKIRSRLMMELMYYNVKMVQQCYNLFAVEDDINNRLLEENDDIEI